MGAPETVITIRHLCKEYENVTPLSDVNAEIKKGDVIAIIGPSGCGKSTLLSILAGLISPSGGTAMVGGNPVKRGNGSVGYMFQHDHLFEWRTIEQNVLLGPELRGKVGEEERARARRLLETYGLGEFRRATPRSLSGGMRQRAALIRTLVPSPSLLLLDEAFSALDYQTRLTVSEDIRDILRREGATALLVTHDIGEAVALSDRVIVLSARPAVVRAIHEILPRGLTPAQRRDSAEFHEWFNLIWKELELT